MAYKLIPVHYSTCEWFHLHLHLHLQVTALALTSGCIHTRERLQCCIKSVPYIHDFSTCNTITVSQNDIMIYH